MKCERCDNIEAEYRINPYIHEMSGREEYEWICDDCYSDLLASI
jgi:hypothetical protein